MKHVMRAFIMTAIVVGVLPLCGNARFPSDGEFRIGCNYWASPDMNYEPFNSLRNGLHASAESLFYAGVSGRPCFPEEAGDMGRNVCSETRAAGNVRNALFTSWANGLGAFVWWCAFDYGHLDFPPYTWTAVECDLGLLGKDYREKPVLKEMHDFSMFLKTFPYAKLPKRRIDAVCLVSERGAAFPQSFGAFALSRQAGFDIEFVGAEGGLPESGFYIMPSGEGYDAYSVDAWRRVLSNVNGGATLFVTKGDRTAPRRLSACGRWPPMHCRTRRGCL